MRQAFRSVKGTTDFYPPYTILIEKIHDIARHIFRRYGFECIVLPHIEQERVFKKGVGGATDIVEKQMFKIADKDIVLRPEGTAQVVRFYNEQHVSRTRDFHKFYYFGSMFRGERPQKGRLREFHHVGAEVFGSHSVYVDAELMHIAVSIIKESGISDVALKVNSLGCKDDKKRLATAIKEKLIKERRTLCDTCNKRIEKNPLRVLDCKNPVCRKVVGALHIGGEHLCDGCRDHFNGVRKALDMLKVPYEYEPLLVRGLEYYTHTVFEIVSSSLGAQDAVGAGGRYNGLVEDLGGTSTPAAGFALGLERMILLLPHPDEVEVVRVFVAYTSHSLYDEAYRIVNILRDSGISADIDYRDRSLKAQLKYSQKLNVSYVAIVGDEELKEGCIIRRDMRKSTQEKQTVSQLVSFLRNTVPGDAG